jgi:toxin YhaV
LGAARRHWRRAKFLSRFRLFFRYNSKAAVIIYAWVNDENTLRKAGSGNDPYHLFGGMLRKGRPPDDWAALEKEATAYKQPEAEKKA